MDIFANIYRIDARSTEASIGLSKRKVHSYCNDINNHNPI
jgi:hypothetical protein